MNHYTFIQQHLSGSIQVKQKLLSQKISQISEIAEAIVSQLKQGNKILLCGNGGSAADAQHIVAELVVRLKSSNNRPAIPAIALTVDTSILTAGGNDYGFNYVFSRQIEALAQPGDILIGISTSGNSENVIRAIETAKTKKCITIGLLGGTGGKIASMVDYALIVPSEITAHIQESHITIGHIWCDLIEQQLYGD
ncbi:MAG: D-sedoheptulose 7-phosphate isomerase [Calditrichia bacterium]